MNTGERISFLMERYMSNTCSKQEFDELFMLIDNAENKALFHFQLKEIWDNKDHKPHHTEEEWEVLYADRLKSFYSNTAIKRKPKTGLWISVAAAVLIVFTTGLIFYTSRDVKPGQLALPEAAANQVLAPGGNKAVLTLANGSKIILDGKISGVLTSQAGVKITKAANGQLVYTLEDAHENLNGRLTYNTIETPKGGQYQVIMPDGTKVWLNALSSLKYPVAFSSKERRVELTGEAYFEVAKNKDAPFKVTTDHQEIEVLGTHFNVNAYTDEATTRTTLLEGSVNVKAAGPAGKAMVLAPGQQSSLTTSGNITVAKVDTGLSVAWKNGNFTFNKDNLMAIMRQISRWYDVEVIYADDSVKKEVFSGSVSRFKNVPELLNVLELTGLVRFKIEGRTITVMNN